MNLLLLMTFDVSLTLWDRIGIIDRELSLYQKLSERGVNVTILTFGCEDDLEYRKRYPFLKIVPIYQGAAKPNTRFGRLMVSLTIPFRHPKLFSSATILKTNQIYGGWVFLVGRFLYNRPILVRCGYEFVSAARDTGAGPVRLAIMRLYCRLMYRVAARIIVSTRRMSTLIQSEYGVDPEKISVIGNGLDLKQFAPNRTTKRDRVLFVGRLEPIKELPLLLEAAALAGVSVDIIGEGSQRGQLEAEARRLGVDCRFLGVVANADLPKHFNQAIAFILTSMSEWSPKVILEAMACGCPVIGVNAPGINELVLHEKTGLLVERSAAEVADAMRRILSDKNVVQELTTNARRFVEHEHDYSVIVNREFQAYKEVQENWKI